MGSRAKYFQAQLSVKPELVRLAGHLGRAAHHPWLLLRFRTHYIWVSYHWTVAVGLRQEHHPIPAVPATRRICLLAIAQDEVDAVEPRALR